MNRKEIEEKFNNLTKDNYIYQRYNGIITKYMQKEEYYIDCATGIGAKIEEHLLLGKISDNIIDLIEVGDIVKIRTGLHSSFKYFVEDEDDFLFLEEKVKKFWNIEEILTKESYMANCYKV